MSLKIVTYYRVSTNKQGLGGYGIEVQKKSITNYLSSFKHQIIGTFHEIGSGMNNKRLKLMAAIDLCKLENATLVVAELDRLSRDASFITRLQDNGINFISCANPMRKN